MAGLLADALPADAGKVRVRPINQLRPHGSAKARATGRYRGHEKCGPTTVAMIAKAFGLGRGKNPFQLIGKLERLAKVTPGGTSTDEILRMSRSIGLRATPRAYVPSSRDLGAALGKGALVVVSGVAPELGGAHWILVVGRTKGGFEVIDPTYGRQTKSSAELRRFMHSDPAPVHIVVQRPIAQRSRT